MKRFMVLSLMTALSLQLCGCLGAMRKYKKNPSLASYDGRLSIPGLREEVNVYRDEYGVPHIFAQNEHDLFMADGYVQAQDRLWEMVLLRALAEGRLSELFGRIKIPGASFSGVPIDTLAIDRQQRSMGMKFVGDASEALIREKQPDIYDQLEAFSEGINYFIDTHPDFKDLPVEFQILKTRPAYWRPADVISFGRLMGFVLGYNMMVEVLRTALIDKYGEDLAWAIAPIHDGNGPTIIPPEMLHNRLDTPRDLPPGEKPSIEELGGPPVLSGDAALKILASADFIRKAVGSDLTFASNNWVISPKMTSTGTAMLANDTHLPHIEPSIWYMSHIKCPTIDAFGAFFPGIPFVVLGNTRSLSWAATTTLADVQDLFVETVDENHPGMYKYKGEWVPFTVRKEKICVRKIPSNRCKWEEVEIRQSIHGPIMTDYLPLPEDSPPVALRWTAWDLSRDQRVFQALVHSTDVDEFMARVNKLENLKLNNIAMAMNTLMKGKSINDFIRAMEYVDLPSQNWMAADSSGNIAYVPGGFVPVRGKGIGAIPVPGESGEFDWTGLIPLMELPHSINPDRGWLASANNEVVDAEWYPYIFGLNYDNGWRAWRIEELIQELAPIDMNDMKRIQNDIYAIKARVEVPMILSAIENKGVTDPQVLKAYELLKEWDYETGLDSPGCTIFYKYAHSMRGAILKDEVSEEDYKNFLSEPYTEIMVELLLKRGESPLFDDKTTPDVIEDMEDIIIISIKDSMEFIEDRYGPDPKDWEWGDVHVIKWFHPLGFGPLKDLSVGPWPHVGSRQTVRTASPADSGRWHFKAVDGPAWRYIIDMGDVDNALGIIDGSISGQWLSPHYKDLHMVWLAGDHVTMTMEPEKIIDQAKYHMVLTP